MAVQAKVISQTISSTDTASTVITFTGAGFQGNFVFLWWNGRTEGTNTIAAASHVRGFGFATGTSNRGCASSHSTNGANPTQTDCFTSNTVCVATLTQAASSVLDGSADFNAWTSDGFSLIIDDQFSTDLTVFALVMSDTSVAVGSYNDPTSTAGNPVTVVTTAGFVPALAMMLATQVTTTDNLAAHSHNNFGAAINSTTQITANVAARDAQAVPDTGQYALDTVEVYGRIAFGGINDRTAFHDFSPSSGTGFRVDKLEGTQGELVIYSAFAGSSYAVGSILTATNTTPFSTSGLGFKPAVIIFVSCCNSERTQDSQGTIDNWSVGVCTSTSNQYAMATRDNHGVASVVSTAIYYDSVYVNISSTSTEDGAMVLDSFDTDGFTTHMTNPDPSQSWVGYVAFGPVATAQSTESRRIMIVRAG